MITKKEELLNAIANNDTITALRIAKDFRIDFNKDQQRVLQIAHECNDAFKANFYKGLGIDVKQNQADAQELLNQYFQSKTQCHA